MVIPQEAKQFKTFRTEEGISQKELAKELGCAQSDISKYENGTYAIPATAVKILHEKYQMSYRWYFHREGKRKDTQVIKPTLTTDIVKIKEDQLFLMQKVSKLEKDILFLASKMSQ